MKDNRHSFQELLATLMGKLLTILEIISKLIFAWSLEIC